MSEFKVISDSMNLMKKRVSFKLPRKRRNSSSVKPTKSILKSSLRKTIGYKYYTRRRLNNSNYGNLSQGFNYSSSYEEKETITDIKSNLEMIRDLIYCHICNRQTLNIHAVAKLMDLLQNIRNEIDDYHTNLCCEEYMYKLNSILKDLKKPKKRGKHIYTTKLINEESKNFASDKSNLPNMNQEGKYKDERYNNAVIRDHNGLTTQDNSNENKQINANNQCKETKKRVLEKDSFSDITLTYNNKVNQNQMGNIEEFNKAVDDDNDCIIITDTPSQRNNSNEGSEKMKAQNAPTTDLYSSQVSDSTQLNEQDKFKLMEIEEKSSIKTNTKSYCNNSRECFETLEELTLNSNEKHMNKVSIDTNTKIVDECIDTHNDNQNRKSRENNLVNHKAGGKSIIEVIKCQTQNKEISNTNTIELNKRMNIVINSIQAEMDQDMSKILNSIPNGIHQNITNMKVQPNASNTEVDQNMRVIPNLIQTEIYQNTSTIPNLNQSGINQNICSLPEAIQGVDQDMSEIPNSVPNGIYQNMSIKPNTIQPTERLQNSPASSKTFQNEVDQNMSVIPNSIQSGINQNMHKLPKAIQNEMDPHSQFAVKSNKTDVRVKASEYYNETQLNESDALKLLQIEKTVNYKPNENINTWVLTNNNFNRATQKPKRNELIADNNDGNTFSKEFSNWINKQKDVVNGSHLKDFEESKLQRQAELLRKPETTRANVDCNYQGNPYSILRDKNIKENNFNTENSNFNNKSDVLISSMSNISLHDKDDSFNNNDKTTSTNSDQHNFAINHNGNKNIDLLNGIRIDEKTATHLTKVFNIPERDFETYYAQRVAKSPTCDEHLKMIESIQKELSEKLDVTKSTFKTNEMKCGVDDTNIEEKIDIVRHIWMKEAISQSSTSNKINVNDTNYQTFNDDVFDGNVLSYDNSIMSFTGNSKSSHFSYNDF